MNNFSSQGASHPTGDGSSSAPPSLPMAQNAPVASEGPVPPVFDGYVPSLASPLRGLPRSPLPQPSLPSSASLHQTLSARRVVFHDHTSFMQPPASSAYDGFAFSRPLLASESYVLNPPSYPQQPSDQVQYTSPLLASVAEGNPTGYIPFPAGKLHHLHAGGAARSSQNEEQLSTLAAAPVEGDSDTSVDDHEAPGLSLEPVQAGGAIATQARKRGRPKLGASDGQARKRRKKGTGPRGGWSKGMKIGPRPTLDPGPEFNDLYGQATTAFIDDRDTEKALELVLQAIAVNPEIYSAHALLSEIYFSRDEDDKAIAALFSGAHTIPTDPEVWIQAANACLERSKGNRETALQQASYCYARIIHTDREHLEARFQRAAVSRELSNYTKALKDLEAILERMPRNSSVLRQIAEICIETRDLERAKQVYENTLSYYRENGFEGEESFTWADILVYVQILALEEPADLAIMNALKILKQLSRWLLGREGEDYWDQYTDDDREFDSEDEPRRVLAPQFVPGNYSPDAYGPGLPLELRVRLGILRLRQGRDALDETLAHFEWLEPEARDEGASVYDYPDLFLEVAQALQEAKEHNQALRYYEALKDTNAYSHTEFWLGIAANSCMSGDKLQAIECYEEAKAGDEKCVEARTQLSRLYANFGDKEKAMENAREAVRVADSLLPKTDRRKYERKEQRLAREEAEKALKEAFYLPGKVVGGTPVDRIEGKLQRNRKKTYRARKAVLTLPEEVIQREEEIEDELDDDYDEALDNEFYEGPQFGQAGHGTLDREIARQTAQNVARRRKDRQPPRSRAQTKTRTERMTIEERESHRTGTINRLYADLVYNSDAMRAGDEIARNTWMDCADSLITDFRSNRLFYSKERNHALDGFYREVANADSRQRWERDQENSTDGVEVDQDFPIPTVESSMPTEYREIAFSSWLDVFLEYALLLAQSPEADAQHRCYTVINAALDCVVWNQDQRALLQIYVTYLACTLALQDERTLSNVVLRWFLRTFQFNSEAYRLFSALNLVFARPGTVLRSRATQQILFKQIVQMDAELPLDYDPEDYGPVPAFMRQGGAENTSHNRDNDDGTPVPHHRNVQGQQYGHQDTPKLKEMNVDLLTLYAHVLYAGGGLASALSYFFRALSLSPDNPALPLSIALSYMHETLKKHSENRQMCLLQGWAFFEEYADARRRWMRKLLQEQRTQRHDADMARVDPEDPNCLELLVEREIAFNRARCWHMLGLTDLAVRAYEKMLALELPSTDLSAPAPAASAESGRDKDASHADFTMEAAYAIQTMYALSGNPEMAREVTEKYLVV